MSLIAFELGLENFPCSICKSLLDSTMHLLDFLKEQAIDSPIPQRTILGFMASYGGAQGGCEK